MTNFEQTQALNLSRISAGSLAEAEPPLPSGRVEPEQRKHVVILNTGVYDSGKRATLAFSAACTAQALGFATRVFLIGDGSHWAYLGHAEGVSLQGFPPLAELMDSFVEFEGRIFVCSACDKVCVTESDKDGNPLVRRTDTEPRGLASVLTYMDGGSSLTF